MGHLIGLNDMHLTCSKDLDCNTKIINSYCDRNVTCVCERGYRYYSKFNKCIFSNHFHCNSVVQCASLDPRLTCVDNNCTCKDRTLRTDNYLCSNFRKYCYKGYRYNVETTDCVFVGDLTINQLESLDQSVEIFVIVLFFITSALFIASCLNNYQNERREKLRRRLAQQQTMSLFAEQRRRIEISPSITEVVNLEDNNLYANHNQYQTNLGIGRYSSRNQNRHLRYQQNPTMMNYHNQLSKSIIYDDLPPSYDSLFNATNSIQYESIATMNNKSNDIQNNLQQQRTQDYNKISSSIPQIVQQINHQQSINHILTHQITNDSNDDHNQNHNLVYSNVLDQTFNKSSSLTPQTHSINVNHSNDTSNQTEHYINSDTSSNDCNLDKMNSRQINNMNRDNLDNNLNDNDNNNNESIINDTSTNDSNNNIKIVVNSSITK